MERNEMELKSLRTGLIGSWVVKASYMNNNICVVMYNYESSNTYVSFHTNQTDAQEFITRVAFDM